MVGFIAWRGASALDGAPIVLIVTLDSRNGKTGNVVQTWILREDMHPLKAIATGADASICGDCAMRGIPAALGELYGPHSGRICYVDVGKAPSQVWTAYRRGAYIDLSDDPETQRYLVRGRIVRIGSYGDGAMVPGIAWHRLVFGANGNTGYTHQWRQPWAQDMRAYCMASVESEAEALEARAMGWRTFRIRSEAEALAPREIMCPASDEAGNKRQCIDCQACDGADRPGKASVAIIVHGAMARRFRPAVHA